MVWILFLHIASLLFWCASLLYLLSVIVRACPSARRLPDLPLLYRAQDSLARFVFTSITTPAALVAIAAGTLVFLLNRTVDPWLMLKMTLVSALVGIHTLTGLLIRKLEDSGRVAAQARVLAVIATLLMLAIVWTVLAKPVLEVLP
jgi:putative membrane protein